MLLLLKSCVYVLIYLWKKIMKNNIRLYVLKLMN